MSQEYVLGDLVEMKKPHPCGANRWQILRVGMDFRLKCMECDRMILIPRIKFERGVKRLLHRSEGP